MSGIDGGYRLPEEIDPQRIQFCIEIPNEINHIIAFWGALTELQFWHSWQRDDAHTGRLVAAVWDDVITKARASFEAGECASPELCQFYRPTSARIQWFPENPFHPNDEIPPAYPSHPFTVASGSNLVDVIVAWGLGYQVGDVFTDLAHAPDFTDPISIGTEYLNCPSVFIDNLHGEGTVKAHLLSIPLGGRFIIFVDEEPADLLNLKSVEVDRSLSFPPETAVELVIETKIVGDGDHSIRYVWYPVIEADASFIGFGGGFRGFELCGFGREGCNCMDEECCDAIIASQSVTNGTLTKILELLQGGVTGTFQFNGKLNPPDEAAGDCAPAFFDHDTDETGDDLIQREKALCITAERYAKAILTKVLVDMNAPQALIDFVASKFPQTVPLSLSDLTIVYPALFSGLNVFFDAVTDNIDLAEVACAMVAGLTGDKNNTFVNFRDSLSGYTTEALMQSFVDIVHASNGVKSNYKAFNTALNAAKDEDLDEYECPCPDEPPAECETITLINGSPDIFPDTVITPVEGHLGTFRIQNSSTDTTGFGICGASIVDENGCCFDLVANPEGYATQGVSQSNTFYCDGTSTGVIPGGGGGICVEKYSWDQGSSTPVDTYVTAIPHVGDVC